MGNMGEALFDLEKFLRSNKVNPMTLEEENIIQESKAQAVTDFSVGSATSGIVALLATKKLGKANQLFLTTGATAGVGLWCFRRSLDSSVDRILSMEGKRIKDEMAKVVLMKYRDYPSVMQRVSNHFYSENVYDDNSSDQPKLRWRMRSVFAENGSLEKVRTHVDDPDNEITSTERTTDAEKIKMLQKQAYIRTTIDSMVDPFDCVFGLPQPMMENHQPAASSVLPAQRTRSQRRSHRRHRKRHQKVSEEEDILTSTH